MVQGIFYLKSGSGKGHGTATGTRREPIPGGLGIASLLCTVPVVAPQPPPVEQSGESSQCRSHKTFRRRRAGVDVWCGGLSSTETFERSLQGCIYGVSRASCSGCGVVYPKRFSRSVFVESSGSGKGHATATGTRREPIPGGLCIASLLCTVPVVAPQPPPLEQRGYSSQSKSHKTFRWRRAGVDVWCGGLS